MSREEIVRKYMKDGFWMDILTLLPLIGLEYLIDADTHPLARLFQYVFLFRILNLDKMLNKIWDFDSGSQLASCILGFLKLTIWISL